MSVFSLELIIKKYPKTERSGDGRQHNICKRGISYEAKITSQNYKLSEGNYGKDKRRN